MSRIDQIVEHVYTAAVDASLWPTALATIQSYFDGRCSGLYLADMKQGSISPIHLRGLDPSFVDEYVERYLQDNPWSSVPELQRPGRIRTDRSLDSWFGEPGYYRRTEFFNEWMAPQDFFYTLGVNLAAEQHLHTKVFVYRARRAGAFSSGEVAAFARVSRHLQNAVRLARRMGLEEARSREALAVIEQLQFGVIFLSANGRITHANRFAHDLLARRDGLTADDGRVTATHRDDADALAQTVRAALAVRNGGVDEPTAATIRRASLKRPLSVLAFPLVRAAEQFPTVRHAAIALIVTDPELEAAVPAEALRSRYSFGATEARLAQSLSRGITLREAADSAGLTYETARWYLKGMFQKTGTARQADLVRLLLADQWLARGRCAVTSNEN